MFFAYGSCSSCAQLYGAIQSLSFNDLTGSALVEYSSIGEAVSANNALQGQAIAGQELKVAFETVGGPPQPPGRAGASASAAAGAQAVVGLLSPSLAALPARALVPPAPRIVPRSCCFSPYHSEGTCRTTSWLGRAASNLHETTMSSGHTPSALCMQPRSSRRRGSWSPSPQLLQLPCRLSPASPRRFPPSHCSSPVADLCATASFATLQDERPTQVLWVGLPGGTKVSDAELHNAFLPCGGLERVKSFSERNYAFVQFKTIDAAAHAKAVMQARPRCMLLRWLALIIS